MKKVWYDTDFSGNSNVLMIAMAGQLVVPGKFEWANTWSGLYKNLDFKKMYLCDNKLSWWQTSFPGVDGFGPLALAKFMKEKIEEAKVQYVVILGLSISLL